MPCYASSPLPVRDDLAAALRRAWERIAGAGTWWSGAERVAIAAEVRHAPGCPSCAARPRADPLAFGGHAAREGLPDLVVEVVHRLVNGSGHLSRAWYAALLERGLDDAAYVEVVGVVATVLCVDTFARAVGIEPPPLPAPVAGAPSRYRPAAAKLQGAWVPTIEPADAVGPEADLYAAKAVPAIRKAMSLVPDEVRGFFDLGAAQYVSAAAVRDPGAASPRAISRPQIELLASRISAINRCYY